MSITDELRKWAEDNTLEDIVLTTYPPQHAIQGVLETLLRIAEHIDAEHESACAEAYGNGVESVALPDMTAYVKLPVDADDVPIHLGDEVYQVEGGWVYTVKSITFYPDNVTVSFASEHGFGCDSAHSVHHYHAPTVEDVLREFSCVLMGKREFDGDVAEAISEYAAKLRLAGDAE